MRFIAIVLLSCTIQGALAQKRGKCSKRKRDAIANIIGAENLKRFDCDNGTGKFIPPGCKKRGKKGQLWSETQLLNKYERRVKAVRTRPGKCIACNTTFALNEGICQPTGGYNDMRLGCEYDPAAIGCAASHNMGPQAAGFLTTAQHHTKTPKDGRYRIALVVENKQNSKKTGFWQYDHFKHIMEGTGNSMYDHQHHFDWGFGNGILDDFGKHTGIEFEVFSLGEDARVLDFSEDYAEYIVVTFDEMDHRCYAFAGRVQFNGSARGHQAYINFTRSAGDLIEDPKPKMVGQVQLSPISGNGCWGPDTESLDPLSQGFRLRSFTLEHELMHALGFMHEFDRSDTQDAWEKVGQVPNGLRDVFECYYDKTKCESTFTHNTPYDFASLMNYDNNNMRYTKKRKTAQSANPLYRIQTETSYWPSLSRFDMFEVNIQYNLNDHCAARGMLWALWDHKPRPAEFQLKNIRGQPLYVEDYCFPSLGRGDDTCIQFIPNFHCHRGGDEFLNSNTDRLPDNEPACEETPRCIYNREVYTIPLCDENKFYQCRYGTGKKITCRGNMVYSSEKGRCVSPRRRG